ncbi:MAG: flavin reductase (DIM6/NTAB) family NADH-FMN oxidoreductase RutF [Halioglobus sp.]|jgi:flavin reductase (DIM6/NTAB) family NADH-FMN oxidoreductase RutF
MKRKIIPGEIPTSDLHQYLLGSVSPRPIAFVSTIDEEGNHNLAPYSFFNAFSSNPPIVVFSSNRKVSDNTTKDTLHNIKLNKECVISAVSHSIMRQMALSSVAFAAGESEFEYTGLTPSPSDTVTVPGVAESPVNMECKVKEIVTLGEHGGAGHLIICEVQMMHIDEDVIVDNRIDPNKIDLVGRMGRSFYVRASGDAVFSMYQNVGADPIGYEALPDIAKKSNILSGNDIGELAALEAMPTEAELQIAKDTIKEFSDDVEINCINFIREGKANEALALLMVANEL